MPNQQNGVHVVVLSKSLINVMDDGPPECHVTKFKEIVKQSSNLKKCCSFPD